MYPFFMKTVRSGLAVVLGSLFAAALALSWPAAAAAASNPADASRSLSNAEVECLTKVVVHEAANQPVEGQVAVARVVLNRLESAAFPKSVCGIINQPHQFFNTASFNPPRNTSRWKIAEQAVLKAVTLPADALVPGALYFKSRFSSHGWGQRRLVASIGDHLFYR